MTCADKKNRRRSKSNSANRICWTIKKLDANYDATDVGYDQFIFVLTFYKKSKKRDQNFCHGSVTVLQKMAD